MTYENSLKLYQNAISTIRAGSPVMFLDRILQTCEREWIKEAEGRGQYKIDGKAAAIAFGANAENQILLGENPRRLYSEIGNPWQARAMTLFTLDYVVKNGFNTGSGKKQHIL